MQYVYIKSNMNECFMGVVDIYKDGEDELDFLNIIEDELEDREYGDFEGLRGFDVDDLEDSVGLRHMEDDLPFSLRKLDPDDEIFEDEGLGEEKIFSIYPVTSQGIDYEDPVIRYLNEDLHSMFAEMELDLSVEKISSENFKGRDVSGILKSLPIGTYIILDKKS